MCDIRSDLTWARIIDAEAGFVACDANRALHYVTFDR
jgi:hypothetical protein